jgi:tetratricopeptide (TPR) repeat protein
MGENYRFHCTASGVATWRCWLFLATAVLWPTSGYADDNPSSQSGKETASNAPAVVCLHTEYMPIKDEEVLRFRLVRELGRQALLIAARDELGLATRDETLDEVFPDSIAQAKRDLFVSVRGQYSGAVRFQIWPASKPEELLSTKKEKGFNPRIILNETENLEPRIRGELRDKLRGLGFNGKVAPPNEKNLPPDSIEGQLLEMNFVSQFAAVRAAHAAIAEKGQSRAWLGVLARGYANLSLMTEHHWKSNTEVFAARALLYCQRLTNVYANDSRAHAERAYALAIVGLHGPALDELKHVEELRKKHPDEPTLPGWYELIGPYCSFQREPVIAVGERRPSLRQLAQRLSFEQHRAFGDPRWLFNSARQTINVCPEEYGVYAALTSNNATLAAGRTGAYYAPAALAHFFPARIAQQDGVPKPVRDAAKGEADTKGENAKPGDYKSKKKDDPPAPAAESSGDYAVATMPIVEALRAATRSGDDKGEPSWSALGELLFEEQFVQAANFLKVAMNATESSHADEVKSMLPAIKGHRYARHIESYASPGNVNDIIGDMPIIDPRGNMRPMILRIWPFDNQIGKSRAADASWCGMYDRSLTFNGLQEADNAFISYFWNNMAADVQRRWADSYQLISPHSPQALRFAIQMAGIPTEEKLNQWEAEAGEDPAVYNQLGKYFSEHQRYDDAIRVFERSIKLTPTMEAFVGLANMYRGAGQDEKWQPTLERFFESESLGLEHAQVHSLIANDLIDKGKIEEAKPHAEAAGETYSQWGLMLASRVEELLGHWDNSEKWIRAASEAYPTTGGDEWYFWCRRTGRGNVDEARKLVQIYLKVECAKADVEGQLKLFTFHMTEDDVRAASADLKAIIERAVALNTPDEDMVRAQVQSAIVARELKDKAAEQAAVKEARRLIAKFRENYPKLGEIYTAICDVLEGNLPSDETLATIEKDLDGEPPQVRVNCQYFLGRAFELAGNKVLSEKYWQQCVSHGPYDRYPATLAGKYLSDRHKTSRP